MRIGPAFFSSPGGGGTGTVTFNPSDKGANIALTSGNLVATKNAGSAFESVRATRSIAHTDSGYFEIYIAEGSVSPFIFVGIATSSLSLSNYPGSDTNSWGYYQETGAKYTNSSPTAYGATYTNTDVIGVAFKNGKLWFAKNNTWQNSGNPAAGTGEAFSGITGTLFPAVGLWKGAVPRHQVGFRPNSGAFTYSPPSGFLPWQY